MLKNLTFSSYRFWFHATLIVLSTLLCFNSAFAQQPINGFPYTDSFKFPTSPGTVFGGTNGNSPTVPYSAFLTSSPTAVAAYGSVGGPPDGTNQLAVADASGGGYLRLTRTVTNQTGYARNTRTFPSSQGLNISFEYYTYGNTADGITFFLFDSDVVNRSVASNTALGYAPTNDGGFEIGQFGGSIGYAQRNDVAFGAGLSKGFLGIAFDEFGNSGISLQGRQGGYSGNGGDRVADWIVLRGDGDGSGDSQPGFGAGTNYEYLIGVNTASATAMATKGGAFTIAAGAGAPASRTAGFATTQNGYRKARIVIEYITPSQFRINVYVDANTGAGLVVRHVIQDYIYNSTAPAPANLSYGFAASTGGSTNVHEIRAIDIAAPLSVSIAPVATSATTSTLEDNPVNLDLTTFAYDQNGNQTLNWSTGLDLDPTIVGVQASRTIAGQGTFTSNASGTITFTPVANYNGTVSTDYTVADIGNASPAIAPQTSNAASLTITVTPVNDPPVAASKTVTTNEDVPYIFTAADFALTDPFDIPANALASVTVVSLPASGTLELSGVPILAGASISVASINAASFTYRPPLNQSASPTATFPFRVRDNGGIANGGIDLSVASATMTINVLPANDPPSGIDKTLTTNEDVPITLAITDFAFTDAFDNPANAFMSVIVSPPSAGTLTIAGVPVAVSTTVTSATIAANSLVYTPPTNASGTPTATFSFQVRDDGGTANGGVDLDQSPNVITINVTGINDAPAGADKLIAINEDTPYTVTLADFGFTDAFDTPPNNFLSVLLSPASAGTLTIGGVSVAASTTITAASVTAGSLVYTPVLNAIGNPQGSFTFQVKDDGGTLNGGQDTDQSPNTISFNVSNVNDAPSGADKLIAINEDAPYTITLADFGFTDAFDAPANNFLSVLVSPVGQGTLTIGGVPVVASTTVTAASITANSLVYTSPLNANGNPLTSFTFQVKDDGGTLNGGKDTDLSPNTISFNVLPVNDLPTVADITKTGPEDATITFTALDFTSKFTDVDLDALTKIKVINLPANGLLKKNGVNVVAGDEILLADLPTITFVPTADFNGATTFKWNGHDGTAYATTDANVNITITPVNDLPVVADIPKSGLEDATIPFTALDFTSKFTDIDGTLTKIKVINLPANGLLKKNGVNVVAGDEILLADLPTITFVPTADFNGATTFKWNGHDGTAYATTDANVNITITPVNDAPSFVKGANQSILTSSGAQTITAWASSLSKGPADEAAQTLAFTVTNDNNALFTVQPTISSTGVLSYTPAGTAGTATVTVVLKDNGGNANGGVDTFTTQTFTITVTAAPIGNTPPVVDVIPKVGVKDTPVAFTSTDFTNKYTDATPLSKIKIVTLPPTGTLKLNGVIITIGQEIPAADLSKITYEPVAGFTGGPITFQWNGSDGTDYAVTPKDVNITINATNTAPVAVADTYSTVKGGTLTVSAPGVLNNDSDPDGNAITAIKVGNPANGTVTLNANGSFTYVHNNGTSTSDSFTYKVNDGAVDGNTVTVTITINASNSPPVIADISKTGSKDQPVPFTTTDFSSKFNDPNGDALNKIKVVTLPASGVLKLNGVDIVAGQEIPFADLTKITFVPPTGFSGGPISFQWNGSDGTDYATVPKNVNITIDATSISINVTEVCIGDVPWVQYTVTAQGFTPAANSVKIQWRKLDGTVVRELTGQALTGQLLWPGAAVDANGVPTAWPGWSFTGGEWVQISDGLRPQMRLYISINPETEVVVNYPPATPFCSANPNRPPVVSNIAKNSTGFAPIPFTVNDFTSKYTDPEGVPLVKVKIVSLPPNGTLKLNGVPVTANQEIPVADLSKLTFEPGLNWSGTTNFTWNGSDGKVYATNNANAALTVVLPSDPNAKLGLAKHLASITSALNGTYDVKFIFTAVNYGVNALENISIRDNLALAFGGTEVTVKSVTAFGNLKANTSYNGSTSLDLLLGSSSLSAGEEAKVELLINVKLGLTGGTYQNSATAEGISSITGLKVTDVSTNGLKPDPTNAGDVSPSESTPIQLDVPPAFVPAGFSPNGDGTNDKFIIQNAQGKQVSLEVYNRWGNRVYKSVDYKNDWGGEVTEGFFIGRDIPDGTYYYIIIIENKDKYAGFITINR